MSLRPASQPPSPKASGSQVRVSEERREIACSIGQWLKRSVAGEIRGPSGRDQINLPSKFYIVVRDIDLKVRSRPLIFFSWAEA